LALGMPAEMRDYSAVPDILEDLGVRSVQLMTNNPYKVDQLRSFGVKVAGREPLCIVPKSEVTSRYLETKRARMGHDLSAPAALPQDPAAQALISTVRAEILEHLSKVNIQRPWTVLSFATSMDGFIGGLREQQGADALPEEKCAVSLSGEASAVFTHHLRGAVDAILVGVGTVCTDDPRLDVREEGAGPSPRPVVLDSRCRTPPTCKLLQYRPDGGRDSTIILCTRSSNSFAQAVRAQALEAAGAILVWCQADDQGRVCLEDAWRQLWALGVRSLMVEGGATIIQTLLARGNGGAEVDRSQEAKGLVDRIIITQAPKILGQGVSWAGGASACSSLQEVSSFTLDDDAIFTGKP